MKDIRTALLAPCRDAATGAVDVAAVLRHLLLFDRYVIQSHRLAELPALVAALSVDGVSQLLNSGVLGIQAHAKTTADISRVRALPLFVYEFDKVMAADPRKYDADNLKTLEKLEGVGKHGSAKLVAAAERAIVRFPKTYLDETLANGADQISANLPVMRQSFAALLTQTIGRDVPAAEVSLTCHREGQRRFRAISNVQAFGLEGEKAHQLVARAIMVILRLNGQIEDMKILNALVAVNPDDEAILKSVRRRRAHAGSKGLICHRGGFRVSSSAGALWTGYCAWYSRPVTPLRNATGMKTAARTRAIATTGPDTSDIAFSVAS
jgi:hypothetical protein